MKIIGEKGAREGRWLESGVLRAAGDWEVLAINEFASKIYATPAISEGKICIRTRDALYAIGWNQP